ncbi:class I SAM-dependent methyltransferase [Bacillus horti]|uniref:SAM-dependent methyltransferase n=1 Tax=Caldalkalibacillus horti TaxID=77523 RepID=A0ABT9VVR2_9BACI|nr:SAM-dependent methyltransferase [Bacillus horti]MDQ0165063.1 SAM-dependent methyltransferase [Bacillus horti]
MELINILRQHIEQNTWVQAILSQVRKKDGSLAQKVQIKPVELKGVMHYQFSYYYENKVKHENLLGEESIERVESLLQESYRQAVLQTTDNDYHILVSKKGKLKIMTKPPTKKSIDRQHNRQKTYILEEGIAVPFLVELGVMTESGKVHNKKYDKYRQINRFLEMIRDILPHLPRNRTVQILDFGCGKSYLTFALYYYLVELEKLDVHITGLDLKEDVIRHCQQLAEQFGYENLQFKVGDIAKYDEKSAIDMMVTLHACDTATDAALEKAVRWNAGIILSVPCCQHELLTQIDNDILEPMLGHGLIKERFASLATDSIRAKLLSILRYRTQLLEFIDLEHTPKNILIRAIKEESLAKDKQKQLVREYTTFRDFIQAKPYLERALEDRLAPLLEES